MRFLILAALFLPVVTLLLTPRAARACAMPHDQELRLARVMEQIDAAAEVPVAPQLTTGTPRNPNAPIAEVPTATPAAPVVQPAS